MIARPLRRNSSGSSLFLTDLILGCLWILLAFATLNIRVLSGSFLRVLLWIPGIVLIPGYMLLALLFARRGELQSMERIALSVGFSVVIVSFIGFILNFTVSGIRLEPVATSITVISLLFGIAAIVRRRSIAGQSPPVSPSFQEGVLEGLITQLSPRRNLVLCLILALAVAGLLAIPVYLAHYPVREDPTTEFYILGNNWTTGDYPKNFQVGVPQNIYVTIQNHEYHDVTYAFEVYRVNETLDSSGGGTITRMDLADTWAITIPHGEQRTISQKLLFTRGGYNKLEFLLFANSVPPASVTRSTRIDQSYRNLHLWVTVRSNSTAAG